MVQSKKHLRQWKHPFDTYPFEALLSGSWQAVELIKIESGTTTLHFIDNQHLQAPLSDIRLRSRKATLSDCSSFLRPGIDICVLSPLQCSDNSDQLSTNPVWIDAKISSIQRKPHKSHCCCQFYVHFYAEQGSLGTEIKSLNKEVKEVGIDQISILQRLERNSCEDQPYRWASSEDCSAISHSRLLVGKFLSDLSWLVVTSALKKVLFCVRSLQNKIVYQILGSDADNTSQINVVNFKVKDDSLVSIVSQVEVSHTNKTDAPDSGKDEVSPSYEDVGLRRSKRRNMQPERYLGCVVSKLEVGNVRTYPYKKAKDKSSDDESLLESFLEEDKGQYGTRGSYRVEFEEGRYTRSYPRTCKEINVNSRKRKPSEVNQYETVTRSKAHKRGAISKPKNNDQPAISGDDEENDGGFTLGRYYSNNRRMVKKKDSFVMDDMYHETKWGGLNYNKGSQHRRHRSRYRGGHNEEEERDHKGRTLNADACKEMIDSYMKNIDSMPVEEEEEEEPNVTTDQWKKETTISGQKEEEEIPKLEEENFEDLSTLWEEMEAAWTSSCLLEDKEGSNAENLADTGKESKETCAHDYRMDEEIGIYCTRCGFVKTEIRDVCPPFVESPRRRREEKQCNGEHKSEEKADEDDLHVFSTQADEDVCVSTENDNVWSLIPELRERMHVHQKKAFEFLWQNIAGSMEPANMEAESNRRGCVISHAPGAGKTFLVISFLVSYLKLFPGKRPLVLAPKSALVTWQKECIKWKIPVPVYLICDHKTQRDFKPKSMVIPGVPRPTSGVRYVLDCLNKIKKWHAHPSVLVMGYTSFLSLMREDTKFVHRKYMAKALRESPGILILDEGHNPRSTKSRLRKGLMKVQTELRILLSGTLFQNNFCEYFNTLCLARPNFVHEVLKELDPKYGRKGKITEKKWHLLESRARKFFLDNIAKKIDSDICEERMQGLNMLRKITSGFIDVYDSGNSDTLPGLQIYTLLMNPSNVQQEILQTLQRKMAECSGYPLEIELLITLGSIHPWLVKTAACAGKFFTEDYLKKLDEYKFDLKIGSKVRFLLSLIYRVTKKEKVLIFCHNLAPVRLLIEIFEKFFQWQNGREVLLLSGELELFERGKVIDKFEDPCGTSKVLLASITACAEGISLTAASRVIFMDSEWNPSKTKQAIARAFRPGQTKIVYVYQLLAKGSLEEDKYRRTTWKEWVSSMIFSEAFVEDPSKWPAEKIEDDVLREMAEEDNSKLIHMIMKNEKASTN